MGERSVALVEFLGAEKLYVRPCFCQHVTKLQDRK